MKVFLTIVGALISLCAFSQDPVADNMLLFQRSCGGWSKHWNEKSVNYNIPYNAEERAVIQTQRTSTDATIDNGATTKEIRYLAKAYKKTGNKQYLSAAEEGIRYLLKAQYKNGGWPQYYPDVSIYRSEITYNDNAMINVMNLMKDVAEGKDSMDVVDAKLKMPADKAVKAGIECILKTQITSHGHLTVWCAQYDCKTLAPAKARAYELPSLSGSESVGIIEFLMSVPHPSDAVKKSVESAVQWLVSVEIPGFRYRNVKDASMPDGFDRVLLPDSTGILWARFYEIDTNRPFFCGRDGVKKYDVKEVEYERRTGYGWYGNWPLKLIQTEYPQWMAVNRMK